MRFRTLFCRRGKTSPDAPEDVLLPILEIVPLFSEDDALPAMAESGEEITLGDALLTAETEGKRLPLTKKAVADALEARFGERIAVHRRALSISSGVLPLADTHYKVTEGGASCFVYVYELTNGNVFFLVRADEDTAKELKAAHPTVRRSAFPKNKAHDWYTMFADGSFASAEEVFDTLFVLFEAFGRQNAAPAHVDLATAHALYTDAEIRRLVEADSERDIRYGEEGKEAFINVDTLCEWFEDGSNVDIRALKEKKLISPKAKRIKILARGELTKTFTVAADSYSADAAKMLIAAGGKMIVLHKRGKHHG